MTISEIGVKFTANIQDYRQKAGQIVQKNKEIGQAGKQMSGEMTLAMQKLSDKLQDNRDKMGLLGQKYRDKQKEVAGLAQKLSMLSAQYDKVKQAGAEFGSTDGIRQQRKDLLQSIHDMEAALPKLQEKLSVAPEGFASTEQMKAQIKAYREQIYHARSEVEQLDHALKLLEQNSTEKLRAEMQRTTSAITSAKTEEASLANQMNSAKRAAATQARQLSEMGREAGSAGRQTKRLKNGLNGLRQTKNAADVAKKGLHGIGSTAGDVTKKLSKTVSSIRRIGIVSLGLRVVKSVFGELRSVMSAYLSQNEALNNRVEALKNAFGQALAPVIQMVVALFERLMPIVLAVTNAITGLIASLGITKKLNAASGALGGVAKATDQVAKAQRQLYGFDQITKVEKQEDSGGESGAPAFTYDTGAFNKAFDSIKTKLDSLGFGKLKETFGGFWSEFAKQAGECDFLTPLKEALANAVSYLFSWIDLKAKIVLPLVLAFNVPATMESVLQTISSLFGNLKTVVDSVSDGVSRFVEIGLKPIVEWLGGKIRDALAFFREQLDKISNWFSEHKETFTKLGDSLGKLVSTVWKLIEPFLDAGWEALKTAFRFLTDKALLLGEIKLNGLIDLADLLNAIFTGNWEAVKEMGKNLVDGLWNGIKKGTEELEQKLKDALNQFIQKVKEIFGIHSPSTVFADIGRNLIEGLKKGVSDTFQSAIANISGWIGRMQETVTTAFDRMKDKIASVFDSVKNKISGVWQSILNTTKDFVNRFLGFIENMLNKPVNGINKFIEKINSIGQIKLPGEKSIGINIPLFSGVSIPRLAEGGIVDRPTVAMIGEAGREAVMPLQNNTGWIDKIANQIAGTLQGGGAAGRSVTIPVYIGDKLLTRFFMEDLGKDTQLGVKSRILT